MSTSTPTQPNSGQYVDFDEYVDFHLEKVRVGVKTTDVLTAAAGIAALVLGYLLLFVVCDHWLVPGGFGRMARVGMLLGIVVVAVAWVVWKVILPARRRVTELYAADMIERAEPELAGNLRNLVDLRRAGRPAPEAIKGTMEKRAALHMTEVDVDATVDRTRLMHVTYALLAVVVLTCGYVLFSPKKVSTSIWRALVPTANVGVATRTEILEVLPGDIEVLARSRIDVRVDVSGEEPESVVLKYTTADRRFVDEPVELRADDEFPKRYHGTLVGENGRGILQDLDYRIEAGDATSPTYTVTVLQPPSATMQEVTVTPPAYTGHPEKTRQGGHVDAFEGSTIRWTAMTNQKVARAVVQFSDDETFDQTAEEVRMAIGPDGRMLTATLDNWQRREVRDRPPYPKYYRIQVWTDPRPGNERGDSDPEPTAYRVNVKLDLPPEVLLVDPAEDLVGPLARPANGTVPLTVEARDDYGLKSVRMKVQKQNETIWHEPLADLDQRVYIPNEPHRFDLGKLGLKPGDVIEVTLQAKDNKEPHSQASPPTTPLRIEIAKPADPDELERQAERDAERRQERVEQRREQREAEGGEAADQPAEGAEGGEPREGEPGGAEGDPQAGEPGEGDPMGGEAGGEPREGEPGAEGGEGNSTEIDPMGGERPDGPREGDPMPEGGGPEGAERQPGGGEGQENKPDDALSNTGEDDDLATQDLIENLLDEPEEPKPPRDPMGGEESPQPGEPGDRDPNTADPTGGEAGTDPMGGEGTDPEGGNPAGEGTEPNGGTGGEQKPGEGSGSEPPKGVGPDKDPKKTEETLDDEFRDLSQKDPDNTDPNPSDVERLLKDDPNEKKPRTKEEVEEELDRLRKQQKGQPGGEKQPGDPETPEELQKEIEELEKKRDELNKQPMGGGEGETRPMKGDPEAGGDPMGGGESGGGETGDPMGGQPMGGEQPGGGEKPMGDGNPSDANPNGDPMGEGPGEGGEPNETLEKPGEKPEELTKPGGGEGGNDEETLEKIDDEIERLQKRRNDDPTAGEPKPGDPKSPEEIDDRIEELKKRRDDIEKGNPTDRKPEGDPIDKRPGEGDPMGEPQPGEPTTKEELDREIDRLERKQEGDPRAEKRPGDPSGKELDERIEQLKKRRDDLENGEPAGGEPMGEPKPGEKPEELTKPGGGEGDPTGEPKPGEGGGPMPGAGEPGEGGQPMAGGEQPGGQPGDQPGQGQPNETGDPSADGATGDVPTGGGKPREGAGGDPKASDFEGGPADRNVENARKATELVLDKLEKQLERGDVDQEMLDRLGWTERDLRNYVDRMKQRFQTFDAEEARPETEARRRQFEEMLRGLDFSSKGEKRTARTDRKREVEGFGGRNSQPPAEYRERAGSFNRAVRDLLEKSSGK